MKVASDKITLACGPLRFSAISMGAGPLVICLHGFPDNLHSYRFQLPALAAAGYHAVSIGLRGYEPSAQPADGDYTLQTMAADIPTFVDQLGKKRAHLVGHDWGAAIAYAAGAASPDKFMSLTTMSVPHSGRFLTEAIKHPRQLRLSWYMGFFKLPILSDLIFERNDYRFIRKLWRDWSPGWTLPDEELRSVVATFQEPGVRRAALSYYRQTLTLSALTPSAFAASNYKVPVPTLAVTGMMDQCIDTKVFRSMMYGEDFPAGLEVRQVAGAGHFPHQEQAESVNSLLLDWINRWERTLDP